MNPEMIIFLEDLNALLLDLIDDKIIELES